MPNWKKYHRQMLLPGLGQEQQAHIFSSRVLVIGAGGLGCPVLLYLASAGVGHLGIIDFDVVEESNLHRQILFNPHDLGQPKAVVATNKITSSFPDSEAIAYPVKLDANNAAQLVSSYDLVIDGSDNFETRYLLNDVCLNQNKPWIYASVSRFEGQLAVFNFPDKLGIKANYRDLFPVMPLPGTIQNCAEAGVLGTLPGIIGTMQANEALKIICGLPTPLANRLLTYQALSNQIFETQIVS